MRSLLLLLPLLAACPNSVEVVRQAPEVDAGADQAVDEGASVALSATAVDHDGATDTIVWSWAVEAGPDVEFTDGDSASPSFAAPGVGADVDLVLAATATDEFGLRATDWLVVSVRSLNSPPTVEAGAGLVVLEGDSVELAGTAQDDGGIATLAWAQATGTAVTLDDDGAGSATFVAPPTSEQIDLTFELVATDEHGAVGRDFLTVTVLPVNEDPVVDAGADQDVDEQTAVELVGVVSDDGSIASTEWTQLQGPAVVLADPADAATTFTAPTVTAAQVLVFRLAATDDEGAIGADVTTVVVLPVNDAPTVDAGPDQEVDESTTVTLSGSASDDGTVDSVGWVQLQGPPVLLTDGDTELATFVAPLTELPLILAFDLVALDDEGAIGSDLVLISVLPVNAAPVADAGVDFGAQGTTLAQLAGSATDADGTIASIAWTQTAGTAVVLSAADVYDPTFVAPDVVAAEALTFELAVTDNEGAVDTDDVLVTVEPLIPANAGPVAHAGADQDIASGATVQLAGSGTDSDGTIVSYSWVQLEGPAVTLTSLSDPAATFVAPIVNCPVRILLELTVADDGGAVDTDVTGIVVGGQTGGSVPLGTLLDLDADDGGFVTEGTTWQHGTPTSGPSAAHDGSQVWATGLDGLVWHNLQEWLCLPGLERSGADLVLSFRQWSEAGYADGFQVQALHPVSGWTRIDDVVPAYENTAQEGPAWANHGYRSEYVLTLVEVPSWAGDPARVRLSFTSSSSIGGLGSYVDSFSTHDEADDPDGDGLGGLFDELAQYGTDPLVFDSDGDGFGDGDEVAAGYDPLNPADFPGVVPLLPGELLDFELDDGGLATDRTLWQHAAPSSGPSAAWSGSQIWATAPAGNYFGNALEFLYLPPVDLTTAVDPTLSFRLYARAGSGDAASVEYFDPAAGWSSLAPATPAYEASDLLGFAGWATHGYRSQWAWAALPLTQFVGDTAYLRFAFRSNHVLGGSGAYIDDIALDEETDDRDGDGIPGVLDEWELWGTDPSIADTDGDGTLDGDEVAAGTDPLNPADFPGGFVLTPGVVLDFEADDGGLATRGTLWEHGSVASGPGAAWSGTQVWATNLDGNYFGEARESVMLPLIDLTAAVDPTLGLRLWNSNGSGDAASFERWDGADWVLVEPARPAYNGTDTTGQAGWQDTNYRSYWNWAGLDLSPWVGQVIALRLVMNTNHVLGGAGTYIDDLAVYEEGSDPDGDGLVGWLDEWANANTQPDVADSDGDGASDGDEVAAATPPTNPAWAPTSTLMTLGELRDLGADDGGLATDRTLWGHGGPTSGPQAAHTDSWVWATNLDGNYFGDADEHLYLPPLDLGAAANPTLSVRLWVGAGNGDGLHFEAWSVSSGWQWIDVERPAYDTTDSWGAAAFGSVGSGSTYELAAIDLTPWIGGTAELRLAWHSNNALGGSGAYVDDFALDDEASDPDGDGLPGVLGEVEIYGTDPYLADTDGDGVLDGAEVTAGTDPLDPASF